MDLVMESILFIAFLHCVLAYPRNNLPQTSSDIGIPYKPLHSRDSQTQATFYFGNPSVDHKINYEAKTYHDSSSDKTKNKQHLPRTDVSDGNQKKIVPKHPISIPKVELNFAGTNGMLPVKIHTVNSDKKEPTKEHIPIDTDKLKPKDDGEKIESLTNIYPPTYKPIEYLKEDHKTKQVSQHKELSQNIFGLIPSYQTPSVWNTGIRLNPMNIYPRNPETNVRKDQVHKHVQSNPLYNVLTGLVFRQYPHEENNHYTSTNKPDNVIDALQPTKVEYTSPGLYRNVPESTEYMHEITSKSYDIPKKEDSHEGVTQSTQHKELPVNVLKPPIASHFSTKPIEKEVILPPVPTFLSLLQRQQIILLNTVAGLPGGSRTSLDAVRAG